MPTIEVADDSDRALIHGLNAALSHAEGRFDQAERGRRHARSFLEAQPAVGRVVEEADRKAMVEVAVGERQPQCRALQD